MAAKQMVAEIHAEVPERRELVVTNGDATLPGLMQLAIERMSGENGTALVETLERLVGLHERVEAKKAVDAFNSAMAQFQTDCPSIKRTSKASISAGSGAKFGYTYAELDQIASVVNPILGRLGLSYSWDSEIANGTLKCTCNVRHVQGHSVSATFQCPVETSAGMSNQQKHGAALTYARRQALVQVLGLTTTDQDNDGGHIAQSHSPKISVDQITQLLDLIRETKADEGKFMAYFDVSDLQDITAAQYPQAVRMLESKRAK